MSDPVAPVSGPPLVFPVQPIKPIVRKDGGDQAVSGVGQAQQTQPQASTPPDVGQLLDITV
jgi:hypothetical protein